VDTSYNLLTDKELFSLLKRREERAFSVILGNGKVISSDQMSLVMTKPENYDFQSNLMYKYANAVAGTGKMNLRSRS
jgi:hypothetical protein